MFEDKTNLIAIVIPIQQRFRSPSLKIHVPWTIVRLYCPVQKSHHDNWVILCTLPLPTPSEPLKVNPVFSTTTDIRTMQRGRREKKKFV